MGIRIIEHERITRMTRMNSGSKRESECVSTSHSVRMTQRLFRGKDTLDTDIFLLNVNDRIICR